MGNRGGLNREGKGGRLGEGINEDVATYLKYDKQNPD